MRIVIAEFMAETAVESLKTAFAVHYDPGLVERRDELLARLADADALIVRNRTQVNTELLAHAPRLRAVGRLGVGLDNIDIAACGERGIAVVPAAGANANAVVEYVLGSALLLLRSVWSATAQVAAGAWPRNAFAEGRELAGKTLGIVGFGDIGRRLARKARALEMRVIACDPQLAAESEPLLDAPPMPLDELLAEADVVTLHVPLVDSTRGLLGRERLVKMKPGAILINAARGGIVDEAALAELLQQGRIAGAALDVFALEPLPAGSPLAAAPNLILTPHVAGLTREANARVSAQVAQGVAAVLQRAAAS